MEEKYSMFMSVKTVMLVLPYFPDPSLESKQSQWKFCSAALQHSTGDRFANVAGSTRGYRIDDKKEIQMEMCVSGRNWMYPTWGSRIIVGNGAPACH